MGKMCLKKKRKIKKMDSRHNMIMISYQDIV